jgi:hypothetical protein
MRFPPRLIPSTAPILAAAAALTLLPGCADFWRVKRPVTVAAGDLPPLVPAPDRPAPAPAPLPPPPAPKSSATPHPTAIPVPGKAGFVFSPYNNKLIDVQGFAPGTLVADPTYPASERKHFRVP